MSLMDFKERISHRSQRRLLVSTLYVGEQVRVGVLAMSLDEVCLREAMSQFLY